MSPTIFQEGALRFYFFSREEERQHVHVTEADGEAKIWIERPSPDHLRWPAIDVDLSLESIDHPERYPLVSDSTTGVREPPREDMD